MRLFKYILSTTALVAVLSFSSFRVGAQPVSEVKDFKLDAKSVTKDSSAKIYDKPTVYRVVKYIDFVYTPYIFDDGFELTSVDMDIDDDVISFNSTCDYATCVAIEELEEDELKEFIQELAANLYEIFSVFGPDDNGYSIVERMQEMDIEVNYNFYIKNISAPVKTITISAESIEKAGLISNKIYSI